MKLEYHTQPLLSRKKLYIRMARFSGVALCLVGFALGVGMIGYHALGHLSWLDSLLEASMILGGMGAIAPMTTDAVKLFASFYALFSGFIALSSAAIIMTPLLHRLLHRFHADLDKEK